MTPILLNTTAVKKNTYDAIVIGSGISGGWAAKELCEKGLKTLVLERGRKLDHVTDYSTANTHPWEFPHHNRLSDKALKDNPIQSLCYAYNEGTQHLFVSDKTNPYVQEKPFEWIRGYHVGGKSLMWARQCYRWSPMDFEANLRDGVGVDWPIRYEDIAPWYSYAERFAGISGNRDGLAQMPDGEFLPPIEMTVFEKHIKNSMEAKFPGRKLVHGRSANLTKSINGRTPCQFRHLCHRGCPFGAYFSSNGVTLPAAAATKKMTLRPDSIVHSIIYDNEKGRAKGVRVIDANTKVMTEYYAKIIFVNAGTLNSTAILLNSNDTSRFAQGMGNDSGMLGRNLMDHNYRGRAYGRHEGFHDSYYKGRRPVGFVIPRFRNLGADKRSDFLRGYSIGGESSREDWHRGMGQSGFGTDFKKELTRPGDWTVGFYGMGECLPHPDNRMSLDPVRKDEWGMPVLRMDAQWRGNEEAMLKDMMVTMQEILDSAGCVDIQTHDNHENMGRGIHEMGTARMGRDPKTSVLNGWNQVHAVPNVFVTDGSCMASGACQNPSITYMALTARAADFAVKALKKRDI